MSKPNPKAHELIEAYIGELPDWSRPIIKKLRATILATDKGIIEDWKWGHNFFMEGKICNIWAFKKHVGIAFFQGASMKDPQAVLIEGTESKNMRRMNLYRIEDVNEKLITAYVKEAIRINKAGPAAITEKTVKIPGDLMKALNTNKKAKEFFKQSSYTNQKEFVHWVETAKKNETRQTRIQQTIKRSANGIKF